VRIPCMNLFPFGKTVFYLAGDHGGDSVKGGGHPAEAALSAADEITEGTGGAVEGRGRKPGMNDPGVPGSRTNPVHGGAQPEREAPAETPTGGDTGAKR
jgi:hypothetical protein